MVQSIVGVSQLKWKPSLRGPLVSISNSQTNWKLLYESGTESNASVASIDTRGPCKHYTLGCSVGRVVEITSCWRPNARWPRLSLSCHRVASRHSKNGCFRLYVFQFENYGNKFPMSYWLELEAPWRHMWGRTYSVCTSRPCIPVRRTPLNKYLSFLCLSLCEHGQNTSLLFPTW